MDTKELCRCSEYRKELEDARKKLTKTEKELTKLERLNTITNEYNEELRHQLETLNVQLHALKQAARNSTATCDASTQYEHQTTGEPEVADGSASEAVSYGSCPTILDSSSYLQFQDPQAPSENLESGDATKSLTDEIREVSEAAVAQSGFVYDPQTGLYYDSNSGYYYDAEKSLYYDPYSGSYYAYDCDAQSYNFHSQVDYQTYATYYHIIYGRADNDGADKKQEPSTKQRQKKLRKSKLGKTADSSSTLDEQETECAGTENFRRTLGKKRIAKNSFTLKKLKHLARQIVIEQLTGELQRDLLELDAGKKLNCIDGKPSLNSVAAVGDVGEPSMLGEDDAKQDVAFVSDSNESESDTDLEDGEVVDDSSSMSSESEEYQLCSEGPLNPQRDSVQSGNVFGATEILRCTPCLRIIVKDSDLLPVGKLYIVTCTAVATIGRDETLNHAILIPDPLVSKMHCDIKYSDDLQRYVIQDHASQCGTFVNRKRISEAKKISNPCPLFNGDCIQINQTTLDVHMHPGHDTCMNCEPGNFQTQLPKDNNVLSKEEKEYDRRRQLKSMKKKYGLETVDFEVNSQPGKRKKYQDRAADRRMTVGSDNPHVKYDLPASVLRPITSENKGHKLLMKMGWQDGQSLGKSEQGIKEPINVSLRVDQTAGLGSDNGSKFSADDVLQVHSSQKWVKARQRFSNILAREGKSKAAAKPEFSSVDDGNEQPVHGLGDSRTNSTKAGTTRRVWVKGEDMIS